MNNPYEWLQSFIGQMPDILQPLIVALAGAIPYVEGEGSAAFGIIAGINPIVAALAGATGNILSVLGVVLLGSRIRERVVARRVALAGTALAGGPAVVAPVAESNGPNVSEEAASVTAAPNTTVGVGVLEQPADDADKAEVKSTRKAKGRARLLRWMHRFGVPGASLLAPLALPTQLTAALFVASGVSKRWVILWQVVAIVMWTSAVAAAASGVVAALDW